jgi:hypothetical protein
MWLIQLAGDTTDLAALAQSLTGNGTNISQEAEGYVLRSDQFASSDDAGAVRQKAQELVAILNGACRLALDSVKPITVTGVYRQDEDGKRGIFVVLEPLVAHARVLPPMLTLTRADGTVEEFHPAGPVKQWVGMASDDESVAKVLRVLAGGALNWVDLYRVVEVIAHDVGGPDNIEANGWATKSSMRLFKHTANSPGALGLAARHGAETTQPPKNPMTVSEARALVKSIVHAWLRSKTPE